MTQDEEDLRADWRDDVASGSTELSFLTWAEERKLGAEFERSCQWRSFDVTLVECTEIRYELGTREAFTPEQAFKDAYMWFKDQAAGGVVSPAGGAGIPCAE